MNCFLGAIMGDHTGVLLALFIMLVAAIFFSSILILRHFIFKPLAKLERSANLIAAGNLDTQVDVDRKDEIGSLASAFKLMAKRLEASFENLEHKVIERTVDLSQAKIAAERTSRHLLLVGAELQALLDNSPVGILFIDNHQVIKRVNSEMEKIIGYSAFELLGRATSILYAIQDAESSLDTATFENSFPRLTKNGFCERRTSLMRKDGSEITCRLRGQSIQVSNDLEGVIWSVEDITSRIHMEQELLKAQKQKSIGVLAGGIAHDFNNILFAVIGNLSLAERLVGETGSALEYIQAAQIASTRAKELIAKLLTFASGGDPVKATASLPDLVRDAVGFVLSGSSVKCAFQIPDDLWPVSMDKDQIRQVIQDLVRNANQSMPEGGTILISFANMKLEDNEMAGLFPGKYVRVSLTDRGRGIEGENLERVFDPYFSTKEKDSNKGSGLGLAIVHSIVNRHDGRITVQSTPGKGTTFTLYLPARLVEIGEPSGRSAIIPSGKGVVLVMDDDTDIQEIVSEMLVHIGYKAQPAFNGGEAIKLYREFYEAGTQFCAVIVNLNTLSEPMGHREVLAGLLAIDPKARVIVSCEDSSDPRVENHLDYGFCSLIVKPYNLLNLNGLMSSVCKTESSNDSARPKISSLQN